jgi:serine/threonine-protein kinase
MLGNRYELDGIVGRGGMAEVFRARDIRLDRIVGVKTLREDLARDQTFQARFRREAQSAASLNHPSIVAVYDTGEDLLGHTPVPYIVMEFVDGRTLRDLLRDDRRLLPERAAEITDGVLRALDYSHRNGIVHRDIKPGNVMLTRTGEIKVMDFGIARAVSDSQATMTQTAQVIGTAQYLSPEQARGERVDARSDLYSTGCLLYELLTGRPPFTGDSPVAIAYQHVRENPIPPSRIDPELPGWADPIVLKAMAKDPADRYQSAGEMRNDLQRALSGAPVAAAPMREAYAGTRRMGQATALTGRTSAVPAYSYGPEETSDEEPPRRRVWPWIAALAALAVLIAGGILVFRSLNSSSPYSVPELVNQTKSAAESQIVRSHLQVGQVTLKASASVPANHVISSNPVFGTTVAKNSKVNLVVSSGPATVKVPSVLGQSQTAAVTVLQGKGFSVLEKNDRSSTAQAGTVVRQVPAAGSQVAKGTKVTIYVSGGGVTVQSVINDPVGTARQILQSLGFRVETRTVAGPPGSQPGFVFDQSPSSGVRPAGSTVIIYVAQAQSTPSPTPSPTPSTSPSATPSPSVTPPF